MGETGCGKTRLIRYMCDLARQDLKVNNLLILKVHTSASSEIPEQYEHLYVF
jgi:ABC-type lipoprotein export system ATPase subunit